MFKNPFSFSGRIRRLEYGLSYIIFMSTFFMSALMVDIIEGVGFLLFLMIIAGYWFLFAQGTKRCHDMGNSGFYQLIPFYGLVMLFSEGNYGSNRYGQNPKEVDITLTENKPFALKTELPLGKNNPEIINEIVCFVLFNIFFITLCIHYMTFDPLRYSLIVFSILPCYFVLLLLSHKRQALPNLSQYLFRHRLTYSFLLFIGVRLYTYTFNNVDFKIENIFFEVFMLALVMGITYIPYTIYRLCFNKKKEAVEYET
ncbi:DUF805 domain-containing protein [Aquimarina sp. 2201CG5-10]|uniref:DUF805 domain-containing protein n=1 Tax=Aquimarina callyspongiae TaxID=3098150 RepID=UPI002AB36269|nr:DUF805 domain-containing protein [Aquimarina sp. 2201CG5-10]MDY8136338.1 DUF805 domain-containing protein [Aquimarina sp. 2201CG5-10]